MGWARKWLPTETQQLPSGALDLHLLTTAKYWESNISQVFVCFNDVSRVLWTKLLERKFQNCFNKVWRFFWEVLGMFKKSAIEIWMVVQGSFLSICWVFKGSFDGVSRVFQDSFVILLFHSSHRSYPSRGRACFLFYFDGDGSLKNPIIKGVRG